MTAAAGLSDRFHRRLVIGDARVLLLRCSVGSRSRSATNDTIRRWIISHHFRKLVLNPSDSE